MTRIPSLTITEAPAASRPLLEGVVQTSPTGKLLNLHAQMAHSPSVLTAYLGLTILTAYFLNCAQTPLDLPADPAGAEG